LSKKLLIPGICLAACLTLIFLGTLFYLLTSYSISKMQSRSMVPSIRPGDRVITHLGAYSDSGPERWDIVIFRPPFDDDAMFCCRVVGLPGETILIESDRVTVDEKELEFPPHLRNLKYLPEEREKYGMGTPSAIPPDAYFVLGDNSEWARDSRFWGFLERKRIFGKVVNRR